MAKRKLSELLPELYGEIDQEQTLKQKPSMAIDLLGVWSHEEVVWKCQKHKEPYSWQSSVVHRSRGGQSKPRICPACRQEAQKQHRQITLQQKGCSTERQVFCQSEFIGPKTAGDYNDLPLYSRQHLDWKCGKCKEEWKARLSSRLLRNNNCPKCYDRTSVNEKQLRKALNDLSVPFHANYRIGCTIQRPLSVDAYIEAGIICKRPIAIEVDGQHHFTDPKRQVRDTVLNKYCLDQGIHLLRIHYRVTTDYRIILTDFWNQLHGNNIFQCFIGKYPLPQ